MDAQEVPPAPRAGRSVGAIIRQSKQGRLQGNKSGVHSNIGADESNKIMNQNLINVSAAPDPSSNPFQ